MKYDTRLTKEAKQYISKTAEFKARTLEREEKSDAPLYRDGMTFWWYMPSKSIFRASKTRRDPSGIVVYGVTYDDWKCILRTENGRILAYPFINVSAFADDL